MQTRQNNTQFIVMFSSIPYHVMYWTIDIDSLVIVIAEHLTCDIVQL